jgi:small subunit ribosomal protein S6
MLHRYEVLILTVPEITQDETKNLEAALEKVVRDGKGSIISQERWGKFKLAYPVQKNEYGIYFLTRFELPDAKALNDIRALLMVKFNEIVMRHMIAALDPKTPLTYQRPRSLEEAPTGRDMLKETRGDRDLDDAKGMHDLEQEDLQEESEE